jgi:Haem-dependent oxidative N-demethylase, alpha subunit-like
MTADEVLAPYLPFTGGGFRLAMGLMPLAPEAWFEIDDAFAAQLEEKRALLAARPAEAFAAEPAAAAPAAALLALMAEHLPRHHPAIYRRAGARLDNLATGERWDVAAAGLHPLDLCGRLVQEDLCLLVPAGERYVLAGASLSAPARWKLADKIGRPLASIHDVVPGYAETLARPVDRLFAHLRPERLVWRLNWGVVDHPARFQPERPPGVRPVTAATAGERLWLRVERQTLRKLPRTEAVVFTIRTHITPLARAIATREAAADLESALAAMPEAMRRYKGIEPFAPALGAWLTARALTA